MRGPIYFDTRWEGLHGIGRFASELRKRLPQVQPLRIIGPKLTMFDPIASTWAALGHRAGCYFSPGFNPPLASSIPVAFTVHDLIHLKVAAESTATRRLYYTCVVRPAARRGYRVLTVSEYSRREIAEWACIPEGQIDVVGNGVSDAFVPGAAPSLRPYFLHVGRRVAHKRIDTLLQALAALRADHLHRLVFTGVPDTQTMDLVQQLGLQSRVSFAGDVNDEALAQLYRGATALVFPSEYEGFGLPIVEAMACGTPVITSAATATAEVAGEGNALLVPVGDAEALSAAMAKLATDQAERVRLACNGLARARYFRWEVVADRVRNALRSLEG